MFGSLDRLKETADKHWSAFERAQDYANHVQQYEIIPLYNKMVQLFTDKMPFTEPSTRQYFGELVEFVEIWNRFYADALPKETLSLLDHREDKVKPLYADVAGQVENLTRQLSSRRANIRRGLHRISIILACRWFLGASAFLWKTRPEATSVCTDSASQGVFRLPSNAQQSLNGVRVEGRWPDVSFPGWDHKTGRHQLFQAAMYPGEYDYEKHPAVRPSACGRRIFVLNGRGAGW